MANENALKIQWITQESEAESLRQSVENNGSLESIEPWEPDADNMDEFGDSQFEPLITIAGVVAVGWLIKKVSDVLLDWKRPGGLVVDTRNDKVTLRPAPRAPRGALVLVTAKNTRVIPPENRDVTLESLSSILSKLG